MNLLLVAYLMLVALIVQYMYIASGGQADMQHAMLIALPVAAILPLACIIHAIFGDEWEV